MEYQDVIRESVVLPLLSQGATRQSKAFCPICKDERQKHKRDKSLSVNFKSDVALFRCHHCGIEGSIPLDAPPSIAEAPRSADIDDHFDDLSDDQVLWMKNVRGISESTLNRCGVVSSNRWMNGSRENTSGKKTKVFGFPFYHDGRLQAVKWRSVEKSFTQTGAARTLWRLEEF